MALNVSIAGMLPSDQEPIRPYSANPFYWQYKGKPILLLGGTDQEASGQGHWAVLANKVRDR